MTSPGGYSEQAVAGAPSAFGQGLPQAVAFADLLSSEGVLRGVIGPHEVPRLWQRHLMNCVVVEELIGAGSPVIDVGSGAGLPGIVLAIARPDLQVHLVEPLARRCTWLNHVVGELGLVNVVVHRGRAQDVGDVVQAPVVVARAVARIGTLTRWCLPVLEPDGRLLAIKGANARVEVASARDELTRLGVAAVEVLSVGAGRTDPATTVVAVTAGSARRRVARDAVPVTHRAPRRADRGSGRRPGRGS